METPIHLKQMVLLIDSLEFHLTNEQRKDFFVGGNMFVYYSQLQTKQNDFRGPDVFVVLGAPRRERKSWVVWEEGGKMPDLVIELLSESTEKVDRGTKMNIYSKIMGVAEYYLYDPLTQLLEGYELTSAKSYQPMKPAPDGSLPCKQLDLRLRVLPGTFIGETGPWLRWTTRDGKLVPHDGERALAETQRADAAAQRALAETQRADAEAQRARELAERLAAYESKFGKL